MRNMDAQGIHTKTARLIWLLVALGLGASAITLINMGWTMSDIHGKREELDAFDSRAMNFIAEFDEYLKTAKNAIVVTLEGGSSAKLETGWNAKGQKAYSNIQEMAKETGISIDTSDAGLQMDALNTLWERCVVWAEHQATAMDELHRVRLAQQESLGLIRERVDYLEGRRRLQAALLYRQLKETDGEEARALAQRVIEETGPQSKLKAARTELAELAILCEQLYGETHIDALADLKDNRFKPTLSRLQGTIVYGDANTIETEESAVSMLEQLEEDLFGAGFVIDESHQTIQLGTGGLFGLVYVRLTLENERRALRIEEEGLFAQLNLVHRQLNTTYKSFFARSAITTEAMIRQSHRTTLLLGIIALSIFLILAYRIARAVNLQIETIKSANRELDSQKAVLAKTNTDLQTEIQEREQAEEALREREEEFAAISESAQDAIVMIDTDGKVTHWNSAAERTFGYASEEVLGRILHDFLAPENLRPSHLAAFPKFVASGQGAAVGQTLELPGLHKDGTEISVELSLSAARVQDQWHAIGIMRDISERKRAEEELRLMNETLEQQTALANSMAAEAEMANAAKSEFLANMSHEIRTPMNGIIGMTGLLLDTELNDEQQTYAETVRVSGEALLDLINDILDFSKIEAGKMNIEVIDFDLRTAVEEAIDILTPTADEKGLELAYMIHGGVPSSLRGDPGRLRQILINLTNNAIKFTEEGQVVVLAELDHETDGQATVRFSVADTGIGIPADRLKVLFESFTQADASTSRKYGGTGLGLAISKQLAEMMDGAIGVESEVGKGSTFWFTAILDKQPESQRPGSRATPALLREKRLLIVDDNETSRTILCTYFDQWGCRHAAVSGGEEALALLRQASEEGDPFDLAVLDMMMPGMNGEELGQAIKSDPSIETTWLIMLTSLGKRGDASRLKEMGFGGYLLKPVRPSQLFDCLLVVCGEGSGGEEEPAERLVTRHTLAEDAERSRAARGEVRVLLAEDNITNQKVALAILKKLGFYADAVANGHEAVESLERIPYDVVLMDCQMPEMDGYEATGAIRKMQDETKHTPIIAMTANAMEGDRERCLEAGMDDYVSKPVRPKQLAEVLDRWAATTTTATELPLQRPLQLAPEPAVEEFFDTTLLLDTLGGDEELCAEILAMYSKDMEEQLEMLRQALAQADPERVQRQAHSIRGASANVGAGLVRDCAARLEAMGRDQDLEGGAEIFGELEQVFQHVREHIRKDIDT